MTAPPAPGPIERGIQADLIYRQARSQGQQRLWEVALGKQTDGLMAEGARAPVGGSGFSMVPALRLQDYVALFQARDEAARPGQAAGLLSSPVAATMSQSAAPAQAEDVPALQLGPNRQYARALQRAAQRSGVPAKALAAIVNAEAGRHANGAWNTAARNPRSSAAGLGQFLAGTWLAETERAGSYLNRVARENGWLTAAGRVEQTARGAVLALRLDAETAIQATADFAAGNLSRLRKAGVALGETAEDIARQAWMSHHLGAGDAVRFLKGALSPERARYLLEAQIGKSAAGQRIAAAGEAAAAHRQWLVSYMTQHVRIPDFLK